MKNKPATINALPPEVFASIFSLIMPECMHYGSLKRYSYGFVEVCRYWRQIATGAPGLWAHIDVGTRIPSNLLRLLLERAKNGPLDIHLREIDYSDNAMGALVKCELPEAILMLGPHIHRIRSLTLQAMTRSPDNTLSVINHWLNYGDPALAKVLDLDTVDAGRPSTDGYNFLTRISQSEKSKRLLSSISTLRLEGSTFPWDSGAYRGLTSLIVFTYQGVQVSVPQIYNVLAASRQTLAVLKLSFFTITYGVEGRNKYVPIVLSKLNTLNLQSIGGRESTALLLPLIALPNPPRNLDVALRACEEEQDVHGRFFVQSPFATLYYEESGFGQQSWLASQLFRLLPCVSNLLILRDFKFLEEQGADEGGLSNSSAPHIPNLILLLCSVTFKVLSDLITRHRVQTLRLELCTIRGSRGSKTGWRRAMRQNHPNLEWNISSEDSTIFHPVRQWRT
ncbi:hypothetical protein FRC09_020690 [Ceratobasidium sp. 395]|nr:hypothetical protein FRC09_020690 [Ceratobasidium sp. 395]